MKKQWINTQHSQCQLCDKVVTFRSHLAVFLFYASCVLLVFWGKRLYMETMFWTVLGSTVWQWSDQLGSAWDGFSMHCEWGISTMMMLGVFCRLPLIPHHLNRNLCVWKVLFAKEEWVQLRRDLKWSMSVHEMMHLVEGFPHHHHSLLLRYLMENLGC